MFNQTTFTEISLREFGFDTDKTIQGLSDTFNPAIPEKIDYFFEMNSFQYFLAFLNMPENCVYWLWGLHGTGKTSLVQQIAARLNWPCYSVAGSATLEMEDLLYQNCITANGTTSVELNALSKAFVFGGIFLFNEIDLCSPEKLTALNEIISGNTLIIPGIDKVFQKHENFRFVVAANTNGSFDDSSGIVFEGTESMNISFMDRCIVNEAKYLTPEQEESILLKSARRIYQISDQLEESLLLKKVETIKPIIRKMIKVANESRKAAKNSGTFNRPVSIRGLKRWVQKTIQFKNTPNPVEIAFKQAITNAYSHEHKLAMEEFYNDSF